MESHVIGFIQCQSFGRARKKKTHEKEKKNKKREWMTRPNALSIVFMMKEENCGE